MRNSTSLRSPTVRALPAALLVAAAATLLASPAAAQTAPQREPYPGFDAYVEGALKTWEVPGAAIAIVRNDSLIYAKGYGVREIGKPDRVTERTMFAIGSASKAFTAAGVAMLVDEKKVRWDAPAAAYLPGFQLYDPYATRELTVRDLLSHRSGLARGDLLWYGTEFDRDEILRRTRFLEPTWSFRSQFGYQNLMYLAAGRLTAQVADTSWDDFIERRIFAPLGMTSSNTSITELVAKSDPSTGSGQVVAAPHAEIDDTVRAIPYRNIDNIAPAGSINSHVVDMAQWVRLQLGEGTYGGRELISEKQMAEMHTPHTVVRREGGWARMSPGAHLMAYGMGWFLNDYEGRLVVHHGGNIDGMSALVAMLPEEELGVVVLTNMNGTPLPTVLAYRLWDMHLRTPDAKDWSAEMRTVVDSLAAQGRAAMQRMEAQRVANTTPSLPLARYAGVYADSMYGEVTVREDGDTLHIDRGPAFQGALEHWHFDTFQAEWDAATLGESFVTFRLDARGKVDALVMDMGGAEVAFDRRPDPATPRASSNGTPR